MWIIKFCPPREKKGRHREVAISGGSTEISSDNHGNAYIDLLL